MKRLLLATTAAALTAPAPGPRTPTNIGIILGFTGPLELITPAMAASAEFAMKEASDSGKLPGGITLTPTRADSTCIDAAAATTAAQQLVNAPEGRGDRRRRLLGRDHRHRQQRRDPRRRGHGLAVGDLAGAHDDRGQRLLLPHRALRRPPGRGHRRGRQGEGHRQRRDHLHQQRLRQGLRRLLRRPPSRPPAARSRSAPAHEDGKADYSAEVGALQASGAESLMVFGYVDQGGVGIVQASLDTGAFEQLLLRRRHVRPEPDRQDRRRDQRQGHRHAARRRGRGGRQVRRSWPRPPAWTRPAPTCPRATTPRR